MSQQLRDRIYGELSAVSLIDPHTHINALQPASETLADILGYHYYTELAHSAGMPREQIEEPGLDPKEKVARLIANLGSISNTIQYSWFVEMAQQLLGFEGDQVTPDNWEPLYDAAAEKMAAPDWAEQVLAASKLDGVFLTNEFDDPLEGFDTRAYIPCLRTDDLVFHLAKPETRRRLEAFTGHAPGSVSTLRSGIAALFDHFARKGARACAISLPPDFAPAPVSEARAGTALQALASDGEQAAESHRRAAANFVFWTLAERCSDYRLPMDLMIGVNRGVYEQGVHQGRDLYDSRVSLIQYQELFNRFADVTFPISVLASVTNQELTSYAWIFPNVVTNGHWWYSNTPTYIEHDAAARLEAVPRTKQIGYYSDMYKLEFALPKFNMYKRILAKILAERFVIDRGWSEARAVELGLQVLRDNSEQVFRVGSHYGEPYLPAAAASPETEAEAELEMAPEPASGDGGESAPDFAAPLAAGGAAAGAAEPLAGGDDLSADGGYDETLELSPDSDEDGEDGDDEMLELSPEADDAGEDDAGGRGDIGAADERDDAAAAATPDEDEPATIGLASDEPEDREQAASEDAEPLGLEAAAEDEAAPMTVAPAEDVPQAISLDDLAGDADEADDELETLDLDDEGEDDEEDDDDAKLASLGLDDDTDDGDEIDLDLTDGSTPLDAAGEAAPDLDPDDLSLGSPEDAPAAAPEGQDTAAPEAQDAEEPQSPATSEEPEKKSGDDEAEKKAGDDEDDDPGLDEFKLEL